MNEPEKPGFLDRLRARFPWFDHVMRAQERYNDCNGNFYAAGITYFTIFALFPLLMVASPPAASCCRAGLSCCRKSRNGSDKRCRVTSASNWSRSWIQPSPPAAPSA
ncbi:ribonuclease [Mycolicibacterium conceptionense]|uniref:Ribonuclease n=1 Tax=Mycolicibacterium conceptionense TaxID=451644 RepID=A0A0U1D0G1_9MYCO|nr:ribonuclease [Mycolicibacterium conceptionense]